MIFFQDSRQDSENTAIVKENETVENDNDPGTESNEQKDSTDGFVENEDEVINIEAKRSRYKRAIFRLLLNVRIPMK